MKKLMRVLRSRRGQGAVEYLLMLSLVVGVVLISGLALKRYIPGLMTSVEEKISSSAETLAR